MLQIHETASFHPAFSPWLAQPEQLSRTLVANRDILRDVLARLATVEAGLSANHQLLVGPRGVGKTHLLCLAQHYVSRRLPLPQDWPSLGRHWVCALFTEEEYAGQDSLANLLLTLFEKLRESAPGGGGLHLPPHLADKPDKAVIQCCFETLHNYHEKAGKRILLIVDNLQKVLEQWTAEEHHQLRDFLSANPFVIVLGSAPSVFREVLDQMAALRGIFDILVLSELTSGQTLELLARRFQDDNQYDEFNARREGLAKKMAAIEVLAGRNPRLVLFLYQIATHSNLFEIETSLRMLLEELREGFIRRFDELPEQARKILDTIARMSGPVTPTEIAAAARVRPQLVNAQLQRLKTAHLVFPVKFKRQRATRYDITERLFRVWRQTATVTGRRRFKFLADFLRLYFTPDEISRRYEQHLAAADQIREEIVRHVDEPLYFRAADGGDIRYGAFARRVENLCRPDEIYPAAEAKALEAESSRAGDGVFAVEACKRELANHVRAGRVKEAVSSLDKLIENGAFAEAARGAEAIVQRDHRCAQAWEALGIARGNLGEHERALEAIRKAITASEPSSGLWLLQSVALRALGRDEEAVKAAERAIALEPHYPAAWKALASAASNQGNHKRALGAFQKAAVFGRPSAELWVLQSFELGALDRNQEGLQAAEEAIALESGNSEAWRALGTAAGNLGDHARALGAFQKAEDVGQSSAELCLLKSLALRALQRNLEALAAAERAVALEQENSEAWRALGIAAGLLGDPNRALEAFGKAALFGRPTSELSRLQSIALRALDRCHDAQRSAEEAVLLDSANLAAWEELGLAAGKAGNHERALEAFRRSVGAGEQNSKCLLFQAKELVALGREDESLRTLENATSIDPSNSAAWVALADAAATVGHYDRAIEAVQRATEAGKPTAKLWIRSSLALACMNRWKEALETAERAASLDPADFYTWLGVGNAALHLKLNERAIEALGRAAKINPSNVLPWRLQTIALMNMSRMEEALKVTETITALAPSDPQSWLGKAWIQGYDGQLPDAISAIDRAVKCGLPEKALRRTRGDLLLLFGQYGDALRELEAGLQLYAEDWEMLAGSRIARACLGEFGPLMEALPAQLLKANVPPGSESALTEYLAEVALSALRRKETTVSLGLWNAILSFECYYDHEWYGPLCGRFLREVLNIAPAQFAEYVNRLGEKVKGERVPSLLNPFLRAAEFIDTGDLSILERLFPEVRELVLDIIRKVVPDLVDNLRL